MVAKTVLVRGSPRVVTNTLSAGPGAEPTMYELTGGDYVYKVGKDWWLVTPGHAKVKVSVSEG